MMTNEDMLIDLCVRHGWALDINCLRGHVKFKGKTYKSINAALKEAERLEIALKNFGK